MKAIKLMMIVAVFGLSATTMGQENLKPTFEKDGELIKGTFYHENGNVQQEGTYKNGELHGEWISYNEKGEKTALAQYDNGVKTGKWFFWSGDKLTEVDYSENEIASVNVWKNGNNVASNP